MTNRPILLLMLLPLAACVTEYVDCEIEVFDLQGEISMLEDRNASLQVQLANVSTSASQADLAEALAATYDDNGNGHITCAEARNHGIAPVHKGHPAYGQMNDRDGDGVVCE